MLTPIFLHALLFIMGNINALWNIFYNKKMYYIKGGHGVL
jgi:hypothetical protein